MKRLLILLSVFIMIIINGIAFNVLQLGSNGHSDGDSHGKIKVEKEHSDKSKDVQMKEHNQKEKEEDDMSHQEVNEEHDSGMKM